MTRLIISGLQIITEEVLFHHHAIVLENDVIAAIIDEQEIPTFLPAKLITFPSTYFLVPGFIDLHIHGAKNKDVMDATPVALNVISQALAEEGVTGYLATTMTAEKEVIEAALINVAQMQQQDSVGAKILGVHLEGPFISLAKVGAQRPEPILAPDVALFERWQQRANHIIKLVTLAPETEGAIEFIHYLKQNYVVPAIGHTNATFAETMTAIEAGCCYGTHLFNAMRGLHQREPGAVGALLLSKNVSAELIADGAHLHPAILELALKIKGKEQLLLVTDAMRAKCMPEGKYDLGGQCVHVSQGIATLADHTLAGSVLTMPQAVRNMMQFSHCSLIDAVAMASSNPAKILGIFDQQGSIAVGKKADLVVLDANLDVMLTLCSGKKVYAAQPELHF